MALGFSFPRIALPIPWVGDRSVCGILGRVRNDDKTAGQCLDAAAIIYDVDEVIERPLAIARLSDADFHAHIRCAVFETAFIARGWRYELLHAHANSALRNVQLVATDYRTAKDNQFTIYGQSSTASRHRGGDRELARWQRATQ